MAGQVATVPPSFAPLSDDALETLVARGGAELVRYIRELELLRAISQRLSETRSLETVLDVIYDGVRSGLGYDRVGVNLFDFETGIFEDLIGTDEHGQKTTPRDRRVTLDPESPIWRFPGIAALLQGAPYYYTANATAECPPELQYLFDGEPTHNIMVPLHADGRVNGMISVDNLVSGRPIHPDEAGPLLTLAGQVSRAIENARLHERERGERQRLAVMASTDALTGLANRSQLHEHLAQVLRTAHRSTLDGHDMPPTALLLLDLDRFKEINDTLGHHAGDWLLQEVADRLRAAARSTATIARLGGDEFAILLANADVTAAREVAGSICAALDAPFYHEGRALSVGVSLGIAAAPQHGADGSTLLRCADVAMYVAKRTHSGYAVYSVDDDHHSPGQLTLLSELRQAVAERALQVYYQPVVSLADRGVHQIEALVRWPHPTHGLLTPDQFIPLAEQTGIIGPLTALVLGDAVCRCAGWGESSAPGLAVAVNISARSLHDPDLPGAIDVLLRHHALPPHRLLVEITEGTLMSDPGRAHKVLSGLAGMGVAIAIDDFGAGYSSLAHLKKLPVHVLKIDRSFIHGLGSDARDTAIVRSIIEMAHNLGLLVVAEGVETRDAWEHLGELGCDFIQGYIVSRPLPVDDVLPWIHAWHAGTVFPSPCHEPSHAAMVRHTATSDMGSIQACYRC